MLHGNMNVKFIWLKLSKIKENDQLRTHTRYHSGAQIFQQSRSHFRILGARRVKWRAILKTQKHWAPPFKI